MNTLLVFIVFAVVICPIAASYTYPSFCPPIATLYWNTTTRTAECECNSGFQYFSSCLACNHNFMLYKTGGIEPNGTPSVGCTTIYTQAQCNSFAPADCPAGCTVDWSGGQFETCVRSENLPLRYLYLSLSFRPLCNQPGDILEDYNLFCWDIIDNKRTTSSNHTRYALQVSPMPRVF